MRKDVGGVCPRGEKHRIEGNLLFRGFDKRTSKWTREIQTKEKDDFTPTNIRREGTTSKGEGNRRALSWE